MSMKKKFDYKWVIIALSALMVFICLGFCSANKGLYLSAITEALDIKRSAYSIGDSVRFVTTAVVNLFFGRLVGKYGTKKLIMAGYFCLICSCMTYALSTNVFHIYIAGGLLGMGLSWAGTTMVGCVVGKWCKENRGTIMGAVLSANGIGGAVAAQIVTPIIYREGTLFGYRQAYWLIVCILLAAAIVTLVLYKENPAGQNEKTVVQKKKARGQSWDGIDFEEVKRRPYFYGAAVCIFFTGLMLQGIYGIAAAHMKDVGIDADYVATVLSVSSLALTGSKFLTGVMYDKLGLRITMTICDIMAIVTMIVLAILTGSSLGMGLAMVFAIASAMALPLETIMLPLFASDLFGEKSYNKILGLFVSVNTAGYALGSLLMNWVYDTWGSYKPALLLCAVIMVLVTVIFQFVLNAAHRERFATKG